MDTDYTPDRLLAFVQPPGDRGPICETGPVFRQEVDDTGSDISDHNIPSPPREGLLVFEGWMEHTGGPDLDLYFQGTWRPLTHWEMCRLRAGWHLFDDEVTT